jgi:CRISPR system Cascade subunit CasD
MPRYLTFALVAPLASFGAVAVGERRSGWDRPGRSAILGLVGACLGLHRDNDADQEALANGYRIALLCHSPGRLLADYHTTQAPSSKRGHRFATRTEELAEPALNTVLSWRDYRSGAWHLGAIWPCGDVARWTLEELAEAMRRPGLIPYLGRKSCPLGLPLFPMIEDATHAPAALLARHRAGPEAFLVASDGRALRGVLADPPAGTVIVLDADDPATGGRQHRRTEFRRDQPRSRRRWQFDLREEAIWEGGNP